uniref:winged helix-turn-helix domain-containing protein n=1 Tax=Coprococcus comes TaxID=410072 RepID=UPI00189E8F3D
MVSTIGTRKNLSNYNRQQKNPLTEIREGDLYICLEHRLVMIREQEITLTVKEFDILALLIMNPKWVFTKEQIYQHVYGDVEIEVDNRVYGLIKNLRKKIEENPETPHYIETIRGVGYRFRT